MTVKERILSIKLLEKQKKYPEFTNKLGLVVNTVKKTKEPKNNMEEGVSK